MEWDIMEVKCGLCNELVSESLTLLHTLKKLMSGNSNKKEKKFNINCGWVCQNPLHFFL